MHKTENLSLRLTKEAKEALQKRAKKEGRSVTNLIETMIRKYCMSPRQKPRTHK